VNSGYSLLTLPITDLLNRRNAEVGILGFSMGAAFIRAGLAVLPFLGSAFSGSWLWSLFAYTLLCLRLV